MTEFNPMKWSTKKKITVAIALVLVLILCLCGFVAYQYFILKKDLAVQLLLLSSKRAQTVLLSALALVLVIIAGILGYSKFKNFSLSSLKGKKIILWACVFILVLMTAVGGYFSYQYYLVKKEFGPQLAAQMEVKSLVAAIGKFMLLPDEVPTLATITDINQLKDQPFFAKAKNGDKILIYANAKEAILYSPSTNKILGVAPLTIGGGQAPSQATQAKIGLRNGTDSAGLTYKLEAQIQQIFPGANVVLKDNSASKYSKTVVVVLNTAAESAASDLAIKLNASVSALPEGETAPKGVDVLVIVGSDKI